MARRDREMAFDVGLIGPEGVVADAAVNVILKEFLKGRNGLMW